MNSRANKYLRRLAALMCLALPAISAQAAPVRVATWNLAAKSVMPESAERRVQEAAVVLKKLNPDVIVLQEAADWQSCNELAAALKPADYTVIVCSAFKDARTGGSAGRQVAILSKSKAYISWAEGWKSESGTTGEGGGFAFAGLHVGDKSLGIFSIQLDDVGMSGTADAVDVGARDRAMRQLVRQVGTVKKWAANSVQGVIVAGGLNSADTSILEEAGMASAFLNVAEESRPGIIRTGNSGGGEADLIFLQDTGLVAEPRILSVAFAGHYPESCELDLNAPTPGKMGAAVAVAQPPAPRADKVLTLQPAPAASLSAWRGSWWMVGLAFAGAILIVIVTWRVARRPQTGQALERRPTVGGRIGPGPSPGTSHERIVIVSRSTTTVALGTPKPPPNIAPVVHIEAPPNTQNDAQSWRRRAEDAERRAEQAKEALREGVIAHLGRWLKGKLAQRLVSDRTRLMESQQAAALKALAVDERLTRVEMQVQQRMQVYEQRIDELLKELAVAKEENRELIRAKIAMVKAEMEKERIRVMAQAKET